MYTAAYGFLQARHGDKVHSLSDCCGIHRQKALNGTEHRYRECRRQKEVDRFHVQADLRCLRQFGSQIAEAVSDCLDAGNAEHLAHHPHHNCDKHYGGQGAGDALRHFLSATVADGRTGDRTNCNTELIGQGLANVVVPIFGGIPVTGAIARTMTNITNGGRTPVAGIVHAVVLLAVFMFAMPLINHVPMSCLAAVLIMVSYNMSGWRTVVGMAHDPKGDIWVLVVTFLLTVIFNLTIAIEIGLLLAVVVFLRRITENTTIKVYGEQLDAAAGTDMTQHEVLDLKPGVSVYEIDGPFFFGAATKFDEIVRHSLQENPKVRIIRMRKVPFIDSTGLHNLQLLIESSHREGIRIVLSGVRDNVRAALHNAGIDSLVGAENICDHISKAVVVANSIADGELSDKMIAL